MPKHNETVAWDDDVWADVDEASVESPKAKQEAPVVAREEVTPAAEAGPVVVPTAATPQAVSSVPQAKEADRLGATKVEQPPRPGVSLTKQPAPAVRQEVPEQKAPPLPVPLPVKSVPQPPLLPKAQAADKAAPVAAQPPPLPKVAVAKPPESPAEVVKPAGENSEAAKPVAPPARKPPSGISAIFRQGVTEDAEPATEAPPEQLKPKMPRPGLGPAFAQEDVPRDE